MIWSAQHGLYPFRDNGNLLWIPALTELQARERAWMLSHTPDSFESWLLWRWMGRYDLGFLCRDILGHKDVCDRVHGQMLNNVQKFKPSTDHLKPAQMIGLKSGQIALPKAKEIIQSYQAGCDLWDLEGGCNNNRKFLNMIARGHLKTTIITQAHTCQWIINYPNVRLLISTHTDGNGRDFLGSVKSYFTSCEMFRYIYPEHVPHGKKRNEWWNQEFFETEARTLSGVKEHTLQYITVGSHMSGPHYEGVFHDDVEDKENVITPEGIQKVRDHVAMVGPLIETHAHPVKGEMSGWEYLTGTFYDFSGLNYSIYEIENDKPPEKKIWSCNVQSAAPNWPHPPYLWPERCGYKTLKAIEDDPARGSGVLASQYLMNPTPKGSGLVDNEKEIVWVPRQKLNELYARLTLHVAIDLNGMDTTAKRTADNDFFVMTLGGFGTDGHLYVPQMLHTKPSPHEVINWMFEWYAQHPRIRWFKIEKEAHARVLLPFLKAEEEKRGIHLPILALPRDNQQSKKQKLKGLQPWFKRGMIHFADDLPCRQWIKWEVLKFPKYSHDDILDTLYDLMCDREGKASADVLPAGKHPMEPPPFLELKNPDGSITIIERSPMPQKTPNLFQEQLVGASVDEVTGY